jgi:hypothetical protein
MAGETLAVELEFVEGASGTTEVGDDARIRVGLEKA